MRSSERRPRNALIESRKGYRSGGVVGNPEVENSARECPSVSEDWRFVGAAGKVEFELFHPNLAPAQPDLPLHIHESSYVALGRV